MFNKSIQKRFWSKVGNSDSNGCRNWTASIRCNRKHYGGYGAFWLHGKHVSAHRMAWELTYGPIPNELCVLHKCDNCRCCEPTHLFLGTQQDNMNDMVQKERRIKGSDFISSIINEWNACGIMAMYIQGHNYVTISETLNIKHTTVWSVANLYNWKWLFKC